MPLAPIAAALYLLSEWLFLVTNASPTAGLSLGTQLLSLLKAPIPVVMPLLVAQALATSISLVAYPRFRWAACAPAAMILGFLLLVLIDNFTYTLFSVGLVRSGEPLRLVYATMLAMLSAGAGWKLYGWLGDASRRPVLVTTALSITIAMAGAWALSPAPAAAARRPSQTGPTADVLPTLDASTRGDADRPNVLFLGVDGIDANILSAYGYERRTTPFLESIREDTLFFENAFSNSTRTHGSLVTLLTGRLPFHTHVTFPPTLLQGEDARRTLPYLLKDLGYTTLQLGMRHYADAEDTNVFGFDAANYRWQDLGDHQGGQVEPDETAVFREEVRERIGQRIDRLLGEPPAPDVFAHVEGRAVAPQWRDDLRVKTLVRYFKSAPRPWFVHLHLLDTHCCFWHPRKVRFSGRSATIDARDSQMVETDAHIRTLFEGLKSSGQLERTIVVVNSDHGLEWNAKARVPLMIRFPLASRKGRVAANVQAADVAPTILAALGVEKPAWMDGISVLEPDRLYPSRSIFGVSDVRPRKGPAGLRVMSDSGPPNYGAAAVMMVAGNQWFEMNLLSGAFTSGAVDGHTGKGLRPVPEAAARKELLDFLTPTGFVVEAR